MNHSRIRVVLIGCGAISRAWLHAATRESEIEIAGLVDINKDNAEEKAKEFKLEDIFITTNLQDALKTLKPDAIFNCTTPESHYEPQ